jgi:GDP-4-dehydro-6-deoxy-D-mannose reductase
MAELGDVAVSYEGDVRNAEELAGAVGEAAPAALVHLAALSSVGGSWTSPAETWEVNVLGTVNLLEALTRGAPEARLLLVSTGEVYGRADELPTPESTSAAPRSPYAASKLAAEAACEQAARSTGLDLVVARAFQHEGPGRDERFAIGSWTRQIAELELQGGGELRVGDLTPERDISDVRDVCRAYRLLLDPGVPAGTYNVASGRKAKLEEVVDLLVQSAQAPVEVVVDQARLRPTDLEVVSGDPSKIEHATGWRAEIPLRRTLEDALAYARDAVSDTVAKL